MPQPRLEDHARLVERVHHLWPGATVVTEWTYQDGRAAFLRWMAPQVAHLPEPQARIDALVHHLGKLINLSECPRVRAWAERLWTELVDLDLSGGRA